MHRVQWQGTGCTVRPPPWQRLHPVVNTPACNFTGAAGSWTWLSTVLLLACLAAIRSRSCSHSSTVAYFPLDTPLLSSFDWESKSTPQQHGSLPRACYITRVTWHVRHTNIFNTLVCHGAATHQPYRCPCIALLQLHKPPGLSKASTAWINLQTALQDRPGHCEALRVLGASRTALHLGIRHPAAAEAEQRARGAATQQKLQFKNMEAEEFVSMKQGLYATK